MRPPSANDEPRPRSPVGETHDSQVTPHGAPDTGPDLVRAGYEKAGCGWGPRKSRPGRSPVASSCSRTTVPALTVAT